MYKIKMTNFVRCFKISGRIILRGWTHIVHQPVEDLLYQTLLIDELLLGVDL